MKKVFFLLLILLISLILLILFGTYSKGYRAGTIMKMSEKGFIIKTYEGQLNTGGFSTSDSGADITSVIWNFSVTRNNKQVLLDVEEAVNNGNRVKLYYKEKFIKIFFLGDTKYFVYEVENVK